MLWVGQFNYNIYTTVKYSPHGADELGADEEDIDVTHDFIDPITPAVSEWIDGRVGQGASQKVERQVHIALFDKKIMYD
jgi:hypothetical protein